MNYAPVIIPTLNRFEHLVNCIESLKGNTYAKYTDLYVSLDCPPSEKYRDGYEKIKGYLENGIDGFANVYIYYQETNLGAMGNSAFLRSKVIDKYESYIFTEDDNIFAPAFLEYMDKGLELFKDDDEIMAVYATGPSVEGEKPKEDNVYLIKYFSAYGVGTWTKKRRELERVVNRDYIEDICCSKSKLKKLKYENAVTICALASTLLRKERVYRNADGTVPLIDMVQMIYAVCEDKYMVCSKEHMIKNMGYDGSGVNCDNVKEYAFSKLKLRTETEFDYKYETYPQYRRLRVDRRFSARLHVVLSLIKIAIWRFLANRKLGA